MKTILSILIAICPYLLMAQNGQYQNLIVTDKLSVGTNNPTHDFHLVGDARIDGVLHIMSGIGNVHLGLQAGGTPTQAKNNTAVGVSSLGANITGNNNTAIGKDALLANEVGSDNVALGMQSLYSNQLGSDNTAIGTQSLYSNEEGHSNIGIGKAALYKNVDGNKNIGIGNNAQQHLKNGNDNIAIGDKTLELNSSGNRNIAIGTAALQENKDINDIVAIGHGALAKNGTNAAANTQEGSWNIGIGSFALHHNTIGSSNTALGLYALTHNDVGYANVAVGSACLSANTSGTNNVAIGASTLLKNTTGGYNLGLGTGAMRENTTGERNMAIGAASLYNNTEGNYNLAIGNGAMYNNTVGYGNIAVGQSSLAWNKIGYNNVAVGRLALISNILGNYNVAMGYSNLVDNVAGVANTALGAFAHRNPLNYDNSMALGYNAQVHGDNSIYLGDDNIVSIDAIVGWGTMSDRRLKKNIRQNVPGLEFIQQLKPVTYQMDMEAVVAWNNTPDSIRDISSEMAKGNIRYTGFIAQEVEAAAEALDFDFSGVDQPHDETDRYSLRYAEFVVPLVKAVQELHEQNTALQSTNEALHERLTQLENHMQQLLEATTENRSTTQVETITQAQLFQNQPNPLSEQTSIPYYIPEHTQEAMLQITNIKGQIVKRIPITIRGKGQLELRLHNLNNGTYYYSLLLDGAISDTKQMLVQVR